MALVLTFTLVNLVLHTRIKFGNMVVSHITTRPYKVAYAFLFLSFTETLIMICIVNIHDEGDFSRFINKWIWDGQFNAVLIAFEISKLTAIWIFLMSQCLEF